MLVARLLLFVADVLDKLWSLVAFVFAESLLADLLEDLGKNWVFDFEVIEPLGVSFTHHFFVVFSVVLGFNES